MPNMIISMTDLKEDYGLLCQGTDPTGTGVSEEGQAFPPEDL